MYCVIYFLSLCHCQIIIGHISMHPPPPQRLYHSPQIIPPSSLLYTSRDYSLNPGSFLPHTFYPPSTHEETHSSNLPFKKRLYYQPPRFCYPCSMPCTQNHLSLKQSIIHSSSYSETCDEGTPQKVSLHDRCPLIAGTFQC